MSQASPFLSICIPTFNRAALLSKTLAHLRQVCPDGVEIVVSDNCSPDDTQQVIARHAGSFPHFRAVRQPANRGSMPNFAAAIALASGEYLYTLSDDDEIYFDGLLAAIDVMRKEDPVVAVYGAYQEWSRDTGELSQPLRFVEQRTDFARQDRLAMMTRFPLLWFPVCRRTVLQRYYTYDDRSFGFWELVSSLLDHGTVSVIPDLFYKHAHTEPRMEFELTKGWYHDANRAQYEIYMGRMGPSDFRAVSNFVNLRVAPAYIHGVRFAEAKREFLTARHFILRARAYGSIPEPDIARWERAALVQMVAERLVTHIDLVTGIEEVIFEDTPVMIPVREYFRMIAPAYRVNSISAREWAESGLPPSCYLVTHRYGGPGFESSVSLGPSRCRAVSDLIESCRITDQALMLESGGPSGPPSDVHATQAYPSGVRRP